MAAAIKSHPGAAGVALDELPEGWAVGNLEECSTLITKGSTPTTYGFEYKKSGINFIRVENLENGSVNPSSLSVYIDKTTDQALKRSRLQAGDLLFSIAGTIGETAVVSPQDLPANTNQALAIIRGTERVLDTSFLKFALASSVAQRQANEGARGGSMNNISLADVKSLQVPIAPKPEQTRIVAKIDELLKRVNASREHLAKVPKILKAFRQSVLAAACSGRLTEDWRERNDQSTAHDLIEEIARQRKRAFEMGGTLQYRKPCKPYSALIEDVPDQWFLASVDEVTTRITSGSRDWKRYYTDNGPGTFVMAQNVRPLRFDTSFRLAVAPPQHDRDRERSEVRKGDILVTIVGANTGDVCRVPHDVREHYVCQSVALLRPVLPNISEYIELYLNSPAHGQAQYRNWIYGEGRPHLSFDHLRATAVALPSLEELREIIRRVNILFKLADKIEQRVEGATKRADRLTHSVLAKAFRGELVPTEAELARREGRDYEAASVLLDRIKAQRHISVGSRNGHRRRS